MHISSSTYSSHGATGPWSKMRINIQKCNTFGVMKKDNIYNQIEPGLYCDNGRIPHVPIEGNSTYLSWKDFRFQYAKRTSETYDSKRTPNFNQCCGSIESQIPVEIKDTESLHPLTRGFRTQTIQPWINLDYSTYNLWFIFILWFILW